MRDLSPMTRRCSLIAIAMVITAQTGNLIGQTANELAQPNAPIANSSFEKGQPGEPPVGWLAGPPGYRIRTTDDQPRIGNQCAVIENDTKPEPGKFGNLLQSIDATPFRGKRVRYRAAVRTEVQGPGNQAQLWFRVDRQSAANGRSVGAFDNMADRPITSA